MIGPSQRATLTTVEAFKLMCQGLESDKSQVIVIGTHKDSYDAEEQHKETITDKNTKLGNCIPDDSKVFCDDDMTKVIYEVDAAHPKKEDIDIARVIREKVEESANQPDVPISWYILQIVLEEVAQRLGRQVFSISECETVASELSFDTEEMKQALRFFDKLNIFFYKEAILPDTVFTSSQVPLNAVTKLVEKRCMLLKPNKCCGPVAIDGIWKKFRDQAKIQIEHLRDEIFKPHYVQDKFTEETFLHMLENFLIVAPINDKIEYFCPTLLETVEVDGFLKRDDIVTRVVHFPGGYAPPGVFCCAVCHLVSKANWKIREKDTVKRNQITFAVEGRIVTFIDKCQYLAVSIAQKDVRPTLCKEINQSISEATEHALTTTHKETTLFGLSFLCPCTDHKSMHPAVVEEEEGDFNLVCTKEHLISGTLSTEEKTWLDTQCSGSYTPFICSITTYIIFFSYISAGAKSQPSIVDLSNKVASRISSKIEVLAIQLGLKKHEFNTIKIDNPSVCSRTLQVFEEWKNKDQNYTWGFLIEALRSKAVQLHDLFTSFCCLTVFVVVYKLVMFTL